MAWNDSFEALKNMVAEAAQAAARVTKNAASVTKANISILSEQDKLKKAYQELGKLYYRDYITGEEPDDAEYLVHCEAISAAVKAIDSLKSELEERKAAAKAAAAPVDAEPEEPKEEAPAEAAPLDMNKELESLHEELDELTAELEKLDGVQKEVTEAVFEVVDDDKPEE